jgi:hypothetical protein
MNKILLAIGMIVTISILSFFYFMKDLLAPYINMWVLLTLAAFALVFGFLVGIKFMSDV